MEVSKIQSKFYVKLIVSLIRQVPLEFKLNMMF